MLNYSDTDAPSWREEGFILLPPFSTLQISAPYHFVCSSGSALHFPSASSGLGCPACLLPPGQGSISGTKGPKV